MSISKCKICDGNAEKIFTRLAIKKYDADFYRCNQCEYIFINNPFWLEEAYKSPIANTDIGILMRNFSLSSQLTAILFFMREVKGRFLDIGGGYGILTRMMRDNGFNFYWQDDYCENIFAKRFDYSNKLIKNITGISIFEVIEHLQWPLQFLLEKIKTFSPKYIFLSTQLYDGKNIPPVDWEYYALNEGQHISFYSKKTIQKIGQIIGYKNAYFVNDLIILSKINISYIQVIAFFSGNLSKILFIFIRKLIGTKLNSDYKNIKNENNL